MSSIYFPHYQWAIILALSVGVWGWAWMRPRFGVITSALLGYLCLSSIWVWIWVENRYVTINPYDQMALRYFSADSVARMMLLLVPMMALSANRESFYLVGKIAATLFVIGNASWGLIDFLFTRCAAENSCGGAGNPSIMMGAMVTMLPVVISSWRAQWSVVLVASLAAIASKSSVAMGLLALYYAYALIQSRRYWLAALLSPLPLLAGFFVVGKAHLFMSSGRFMIWEYMLNLWAAPHNVLFGVGFGTYHVFSIHLQQIKNVASGMHWNSMHNDFLEILFVGGAAGAALFTTSYFVALWKMIREREEAAMSIFLFGLYMFVNPALHHAIPSLFGAWVFTYALRREGSFTNKEIAYV